MKGKFLIYALLVSLFFTAISWSELLSSPTNDSKGRKLFTRGSSWGSNTGGDGGSWGGGGHK